MARVISAALRRDAILVNNAAISPKRKDPVAPWFAQISLEEWAQVIDINLSGPFICYQSRRARNDRPAPWTHYQHRSGGGPCHAVDRGTTLCGIQGGGWSV
jgi:NAD(P)-dependent dehydrogenase (short-subunit alcohol dehydrogenase family)